MKIHRKTFFRVIFLLAALFCFEINAYSNNGLQSISIELSTGTNSTGNGFSWDIDSFNEDEIYQTLEFCLIGKPINHLPVLRNNFLIYNFYFSVWQPPKIY